MGSHDDSEPCIEFVCHGSDYDNVPKPVPATRAIPEWYQQLGVEFEDDQSTVKQCRPFFDALTFGWMIPLPTDIHVEAEEPDEIQFEYDYDIPLIHPHAEGEMGPDTPYENTAVLQWLSPWRIRVPDGYSVLLVPPMNRREPRFSVFSGIIDFDNCFFNINSPFAWQEIPYSGTIKKGTPIAQIIPFKRDGIISDGVIREMTESDVDDVRKEVQQKESNFSRYKDEIWVPKTGARVIEKE